MPVKRKSYGKGSQPLFCQRMSSLIENSVNPRRKIPLDLPICYDLVTYGVLNRSKDKGVSRIKHFKNKWYWLLMPPFFVAAVLTLLLLPEGQGHYAFLIIFIFWIVYYTVNHFSKKKYDTEHLE